MDPGFVDIGFARVDTGRLARRGFPEVIYCAGKTPEQVAAIAATLADHNAAMLATRAEPAHFEAVRSALPESVYHPVARCIVIERTPLPRLPGRVALICAGTSDLPVFEEAAVTLGVFGCSVERVTDAGVAGIHRLLAERERIEGCDVLVVVAGMEGALPSVIAGMVSRPIIAVPTSIGYGAAFGGLAALLGMLTSCGSGVTVVNIDNGFGAACAAAAICRLLVPGARDGGSPPTGA
jgi:NCAIR mutase (PurE)-related protein